MRFTWDLNENRLYGSVAGRLNFFNSDIFFKLSDALTFELQFARNGSVVDPGTIDLTLCLKANNDFEGAALVLATAWTKTGSGETALWTCYPDFSGNALKAEFDASEDRDTFLFELEFTQAGRPTSTRRLRAIVENDVIKGTESIPPSSPQYPSVNQAIPNFYDVDGLLNGSTPAKSIVTTSRVVGAMFVFHISGYFLWFRLISSTASNNVPHFFRPDDWASGTNEKVFELLSVFRGGLPMVWNPDQSRFHQFQITGALGAEQFTPGPPLDLSTL